MTKRVLTCCLLGSFAVFGCEKTPEPATTTSAPTSRSAATSTTTAAQSAPAPAAKPRDLSWDAPASWKKVDSPSPMRKATYKIPKAAGDPEDAELSISQAGGTVEANVTRWEGQFADRKEPTKREPKTVGDLKVTIVEIKGRFTGSGMPGGPPGEEKPGWAMLGAIVETSPPHFFKLTGPEKTVIAARAHFDKMIDSLRAK